MPDRDGIGVYGSVGLTRSTDPVAHCHYCDTALFAANEIREHRRRCGRGWRTYMGSRRERTREARAEMRRLLDVGEDDGGEAAR